MTVSTTASRISYSGNGVTTVFSFPYYFLLDADLVVILRNVSTGVEVTQVITTNYTVAGAGLQAGGTITMLVAPPTGYSLTIYRDPAALQPTDLRETDSLPAESLEKSLDRDTMGVQRVKDQISRTVRLSDGFTDAFNPVLPSLIEAGRLLKANDTADGWEFGASDGDIEAAAANAAAAAASAAAASSSASDASDSADDASDSAIAAAASEAAAASSASDAASSAVDAAASAAAAIAAVDSALWNDVLFKVFADSPVSVLSTDSGTLFAVDASGGNVVLNLPQISSLTLTDPWALGIKKTDNSANTVTINSFAGDTIDDGVITSKVLSTQNSGTVLVPDADPAPDRWTSLDFGPTATSGAYQVVGTNGSPTVYSGGTISPTYSVELLFIRGNANLTPTLGNGTTVGQIWTWHGKSGENAAQTVTIPGNASNINLNGPWSSNDGLILSMIWTGVYWTEAYRSGV